MFLKVNKTVIKTDEMCRFADARFLEAFERKSKNEIESKFIEGLLTRVSWREEQLEPPRGYYNAYAVDTILEALVLNRDEFKKVTEVLYSLHNCPKEGITEAVESVIKFMVYGEELPIFHWVSKTVKNG